MSEGNTVYRAFAQSDAAHVRLNERDHTHDNAGPLHKSCILYSATVCPYLREKNSRLHKGSLINPGGKRGTRAAVMGFKNYGVMFYEGRPSPRGEPLPMIAYFDLADDIPYCDGSDLTDHLEAAIASDRQLIDMSVKRMYWSDDASDIRDLNQKVKAQSRAVRAREPWDTLVFVDGIPYAAFPQ
jgi:hypothetical protein